MLSEILERTRKRSPLIHCMVNLVTANDCANLVLASGASPIMAEDVLEVEQVMSVCDGLVLNLGTPSPQKIQALLSAGETAKGQGKPIVFDPVGVGCSDFRRLASQDILTRVCPQIIRGNASEISTLLYGTVSHRGVDTEKVTEEYTQLANLLARKVSAIVVVTGEVDIVTDGTTTYRVYNGHPMMQSITGTGCQMSALIGTYVAANPEQPLTATLAGVCAYGLCGELAKRRLGLLDGNISYRNNIIDTLYRLTGEMLEEGAKYEIC